MMAVSQPLTIREIKTRSLKPVDAWWVVLVIDPIAVRILWFLCRFWPSVTPGMVTTASLVTGVAAAFLYGKGMFVWGALLFQVSFLLDCVDGKLARLQGTTSRWGGFYDGLVNNLVFGLSVFGLALSPAGDRTLALAAMALLFGWALHIYVAENLKTPEWRVHSPYVPKQGSWLQRHRLLPPLTFPDKHAILFVFGPVTGYVVHALVAIAALELATLAPKLVKAYLTLRQPAADAVVGGPEHAE